VADVSNSDGNSQSDNFDDELTTSGSESTKRAKVVAATSAAGMNFNFGSLTIGKDCIQTMEGLSYYTMGSAQALGSESMPEPQVDEAMVFEDLFAAGLRMSPHPVLTDILQKF
jgi:hypothetical protein